MILGIHHLEHIYLWTENCPKLDYFCHGGRMINPDGDNAETWRDCGRMCLHTPRCKSWDFVWDEYGMCLMYMGSCTFHSRVGSIAGMKACPYGAFPGKSFSKIIFS